MLQAAHNETAIGTLAACGKLSALAGTFVIGVAHFLTPTAVGAFASRGLRGLHRVLLVTGVVFAATVGGFCVLVALYGDPLMVTLFGDEFAGTGRIAALLSGAVLVNSMAVVAGNALWAIHRPQANLIGDAVTLVVTLLLATWLVGPWGALGIATSMLIGTTVGAAVRWLTFWLSTRELRRDEETLL
jgi:O-antigen/teichoic acid export membrane protein